MTDPHMSPPNGAAEPASRSGDPDLVIAEAIAAGRLATLPAETGLDDCDVAERATCAVVMGELASADAAWLDDHLGTCPDCARSLDRATTFHATLGQLSAIRAAEVPAVAPPLTFLPTRRISHPPAVRPVSVGRVPSPVGDLLVALSPSGVCEVGFAASTSWQTLLDRLRGNGFAPEDAAEPTGDLVDAGRQLGEYFTGERQRIDLPIDLSHVTPFTRSVLDATRQIPYGATATYGEVARRIGRPSASRAVGNALGRNPVPLVIPCHRVVRGDRTSGGFMGGFVGGPEIKRHLLTLEGSAAGLR